MVRGAAEGSDPPDIDEHPAAFPLIPAGQLDEIAEFGQERALVAGEELFHAGEGWVSATSENMSLHVDMAAGKTAPFPAEVARCLERMKASHANLPRPEAVGRRIAMPGQS